MAKVTTRQKELATAEIRRLFKEGYSRYEVGRRTGVNPGTAWNIAHRRPSEKRMGRAGTKSAKAVIANIESDSKMRVMRGYDTIWMKPATPRDSSILGEYWNAVQTARGDTDKKTGLRRPGDWKPLKQFKGRGVWVVEKGKRVRYDLITDPEVIKKLEDRNKLDPAEVSQKGHRKTLRKQRRRK